MSGVLVDECVGYRTVYHRLRKMFGPAYPVEHVSDVMPGASDPEVLDYAKRHNYLVVTQDRKFPSDDLVLTLKKKNLKQIERQLESLLIEC